jgi:uncharacterized protein
MFGGAGRLVSRLLDKEMVRETRSGDAARVGELLDRGVSIHRLYSRDGFTPLMRAAYYGHPELVQFLLARGADPNQTAADGAGALFWASLRGHEAIVELLLDSGADVDAVRRPDDPRHERTDGPTPLNVAISHGHLGIAARLLQAGASVDHRYLGRDMREYAEWHQATALLPLLKEQRGR